MSSKRQATTDLNHDNWDQEEEPEERGTFRTATEDELKSRVIKRARRKIVSDDNESDTPKSVFSGFSGFANTTNASSGGFSFLSKIPVVAAQEDKTFSNNFKFSSTSSSTTTTSPSSSTTSFNNNNVNSNTSNKTIFGNSNNLLPTNNTDVNQNKTTKTCEKSKEYCAKLMSLNRAVRDWINTHVNKDPLCYLTPIFKDYENYIKRFDDEEKNVPITPASTSNNSSNAISNSSPLNNNNKNSIFGGNKEINNTTTTLSTQDTTKTNGFSFNFKPTTSATATTSGFSFGKPNTTDNNEGSGGAKSNASFSGFKFSSSTTPFTFGNIKPPAANAPTNEADDDDEITEPPKAEFKQVNKV